MVRRYVLHIVLWVCLVRAMECCILFGIISFGVSVFVRAGSQIENLNFQKGISHTKRTHISNCVCEFICSLWPIAVVETEHVPMLWCVLCGCRIECQNIMEIMRFGAGSVERNEWGEWKMWTHRWCFFKKNASCKTNGIYKADRRKHQHHTTTTTTTTSAAVNDWWEM